jgi:23S rRNA pseudouridine1911/1915/1917 synthase
MKFKVKTSGERVDTFLAKELKISRSLLEKLFDDHQVQVNDNIAKKAYRLQEGDTVTCATPKIAPTKLSASTMPLEILYEDKEMLVINKPAGVVVHPDSTGHQKDTIANAVLSHLKIKPGKDLRPGIVHRLDKDTSGALVIAKTTAALTRLSKLFLDREVHKTYLALVKGTPRTDTGRIDAPIRRSSKNRQQMAIHSGGRRAVTTFEIDHTWGWCSLLKVNIETGRTHQIRLHLASIGHPVLGDTTYGERAANAQAAQKLGLHRQWLHAWKLQIAGHQFEAPVAEELKKALPKT